MTLTNVHRLATRTLWALCLFIGGCKGTYEYFPPTEDKDIERVISVPAPKHVVWKRLLPGVTEKFFDVKQMDEDSGFINVSFTADPSDYLDCGRINSYIKDGAGERNYNFGAASEGRSYEIMGDTGRERIYWRMNMQVSVNILLQQDGSSTRVRVNALYEPIRIIDALATKLRLTPYYVDEILFDDSDRQWRKSIPEPIFFQSQRHIVHDISFKSGERKSFPGVELGSVTHYVACVSNGRLEKELLDMARLLASR